MFQLVRYIFKESCDSPKALIKKIEASLYDTLKESGSQFNRFRHSRLRDTFWIKHRGVLNPLFTGASSSQRENGCKDASEVNCSEPRNQDRCSEAGHVTRGPETRCRLHNPAATISGRKVRNVLVSWFRSVR